MNGDFHHLELMILQYVQNIYVGRYQMIVLELITDMINQWYLNETVHDLLDVVSTWM